MDQIKAGVKTSEFWVGLGTAVLTFLNTFFHWNLPIQDILGLIALSMTYIYGRSKVKSGS